MINHQKCDLAFERDVLLKCYEALVAVGFTRFRKDGVDWPMERGFHCWVGLNTSREKEHLDINPFVGVHVVPIMKFYTSLEGRKYSRSTATYSIHLGRLAPSEPTFRFTPDTDVLAEASRLARLYAGVGLTYSLSIGTYELLLPLLDERVSSLGGYPERLASCLYLMGRKEEAKLFVKNFLQLHRDYFKDFAEPFLKIE